MHCYIKNLIRLLIILLSLPEQSHNGGHPLVAFRKTLILLLVILLASAAEARLGSMQFKQHVDEMETTAVNKAASNKHRALGRKGKKLPKPEKRALNAPPTDKFRELALEKAAARKKVVAEKKKLAPKKKSVPP